MVLVLSTIAESSFSQNDFEVSWNAHLTGDTIEEDPFNGSFTIINVGESILNANDTIWYGYLIDGEMFDIALNPETVSGEVLDGDFAPGDEIVVINDFFWPLLGSGVSVDICAVVYGVGYESYTGDYFTGDDDNSNNTDCLLAILPEYALGLSELNQSESTSIQFSNHYIFINNSSLKFDKLATLEIYSLDGRLLYDQIVQFDLDSIQMELPDLGTGAYVGRLISETAQISKKFVIN